MNASSENPPDATTRDERRDCASRPALPGVVLILFSIHAVSAIALIRHHRSTPIAPTDIAVHLNPNDATREQLMLLPGIGPGRADAIIQHRTSLGGVDAFESADGLEVVHGIGPRTIERIRPFLIFDDSRRGPVHE